MNDATTRKSIARSRAHRSERFSPGDSMARKLVMNTLTRIEQDCLRIHEGDDCHHFGQAAEQAEIVADIHVHDERAYKEVAFGGSVGSGESYMAGHWSTPNLTNVVRIFVRNLDTLDQMDSSQSWISKQLLRLYELTTRNSKARARDNISAHYDLGNDFFSLFLDRSRMYSSAIYPTPESSLDEAALHKLKVCCDKLALGPDDHLLEIGTGWGGMAIYAATHYGCRVTTTTISREQYEYARQRVADADLSDQIEVRFDDYRDLTGRYNKLVSIEMIEAVGHEHYHTYFKKCGELLSDDGLMLLQAITIADQRYEMARRHVDFIQRYIFPGGGLPSVNKVTELVGRATSLNLLHFEDIGAHYARTLRDWRLRFKDKLEDVRRQGFDERFIRMWEYYLCYCEGGFTERSIGTGHFLLAGPAYRPSEAP